MCIAVCVMVSLCCDVGALVCSVGDVCVCGLGVGSGVGVDDGGVLQVMLVSMSVWCAMVKLRPPLMLSMLMLELLVLITSVLWLVVGCGCWCCWCSWTWL